MENYRIMRYVTAKAKPFPRSGHGQVESVSAHIRLSELTVQGNVLSLLQELREHPEHRFQLLIGLLQTCRSTTDVQGINPDVHSLTSPERLMHDIMQSREQWRLRKGRQVAVSDGGEGLEKKNEDIAAANFQCNICYELAKVLVVTLATYFVVLACASGFMLIPVNSECPVCKGQVLELNVTPIYGRGGEES